MTICPDDGTWQIVAAALATNEGDDDAEVGHLLDQVSGPVTSFTADSARPRRRKRLPEAAVVVPPRSTAVPTETGETKPAQCDR